MCDRNGQYWQRWLVAEPQHIKVYGSEHSSQHSAESFLRGATYFPTLTAQNSSMI